MLVRADVKQRLDGFQEFQCFGFISSSAAPADPCSLRPRCDDDPDPLLFSWGVTRSSTELTRKRPIPKRPIPQQTSLRRAGLRQLWLSTWNLSPCVCDGNACLFSITRGGKAVAHMCRFTHHQASPFPWRISEE